MTCLYNGIPLPVLPTDILGVIYDYAYVDTSISGDYILHFTNSPIIQKGTRPAYQNIPAKVWSWHVSDGEWSSFHATDGTNIITGTPVIWANHDILNEDGSLYLAASDPVPVSPVPQLNPAALMQGFATMLSLRRNRP